MSPSSGLDDTGALGDLDLTTMSPLCHRLLETKKRMMSALAAESGAGARSDDEDLLAGDTPYKPSKAAKLTSDASSNNTAAPDTSNNNTSALSPDAILQRKAQRRREQVRAASRRCRDRQRVRCVRLFVSYSGLLSRE